MKLALVVQGGYEGHEPEQVSAVLAEALSGEGFEVEVSDTLDSFRDQAKLEAWLEDAMNRIAPPEASEEPAGATAAA